MKKFTVIVILFGLGVVFMSLIRGGFSHHSATPNTAAKSIAARTDGPPGSSTAPGGVAGAHMQLFGSGSAHVSGATIAPSGAMLIVNFADAGGNPTPLTSITLGTVESLKFAGAAGTYTLTLGGATTPALPLGASAAIVQTALAALPVIGAGNVSVTGTPGLFIVTFVGSLAAIPQTSISINTGGLAATASAPPLTAGTTARIDLYESGTNCVLAGVWHPATYGSGGGHHEVAAGGTGANNATWAAHGLATGLYRVYATWVGAAGHATAARYRFYDGSTYLGFTTVDQSVDPIHDDPINAGQSLATVYVSSGTLTVVLADDTTGVLIANLVSVVPYDPAGLLDLRDDSDSSGRVVFTSGWSSYGDGATWGGRFSYNDQGVKPATLATYTFDGLAPGTYQIQASWTPNVNRSHATVYKAYEGTNPIATFTVDQTVAPADATYTGVGFKTLGTATITGRKLQVTISGPTDGYAIADAVVVKLTTPAIYREAVSGNSSYINRGTLPTAKVNGSSLSFSTPIWHTPDFDGDTNALPYLIYPLSTAVSARDTVTVSIPDGLLTTAAGPVGSVTDLAVTNKTGGKLLPALPNTARTLRIGYNLHPALSYPVCTYSNLMKGAESWLTNDSTAFTYDSNGYPVFNKPSGVFCAVRSGGYNLADPKGYPCGSLGTYTLIWDSDGTGDCILQAANGVVATLLTADFGHATNNKRTYQLSLDSTVSPLPYFAGVYCQIVARTPGTPATNIRIYPPEIDVSNPPKFHPEFVRMCQNSGTLRTMQMLGANSSTLVEYTDYPPQTQRSYQAPDNRQQMYNITSIGPYTDTTNFSRVGDLPMLVTLDRPHNIVTGQIVVLNPPSTGPDPGRIVIHMSGGGYTELQYGGLVTLYVPGIMAPNQFATANQATAAITPVSPVYTYGGKVQVSTVSVPPEDYVELLNLVPGCEAWVNVSQCASDDLVKQLFTMVGQRLGPGRRIYCEVGNEHWNTGPGFGAGFYWISLGQQLGGGPTFGYTIRSGHVHKVAKQALASVGRGGDFRGIFGSQATVTGLTSVIVNTAKTQNPPIPVDAVAVAPYTGTYPSSEASFNTIAGSLTVDQVLDILERFMLENWAAKLGADHFATANSVLPGVEIIAYEGSLAGGYAGGTELIKALQSQAVSHHPRTYDILMYYFQTLQDQGKFDRFAYYSLIHPYGNEGSVSSTIYGAYQAWNMKAGRGDGRDGLYDTRPDLKGIPPGAVDLSKAPSVIGGAINDWQMNTSTLPGPVAHRVGVKRSSRLGRSPRGAWRR